MEQKPKIYYWKIRKIALGCEEFKYLRVKIGGQENFIKNRITKGRTVTAMLNSVLWNRQVTRKINY